MLDINKRTMMEVSSKDRMYISGAEYIAPNLTHWSQNITAPTRDSYFITLARKVSKDEIRNMKLDMMPGFRFTWNYDMDMDMDMDMQPEAKYINEVKTNEFIKCVK